MADLYTDARDEQTIEDVLLHGLSTQRAPKLRVLRIAYRFKRRCGGGEGRRCYFVRSLDSGRIGLGRAASFRRT